MNVGLTPDIRETLVGPTPPYIDLERAIHPEKVLSPVPPFVDLERAIHPTKVLAPTPALEVPTVQGVMTFVQTKAVPFLVSGTFIVGLLAGYILRDAIKKNVVSPVVGVVSRA